LRHRFGDRRLRPAVRMIVVESEAAQPAAAALQNGGPVRVAHRQSFVDGMGSSTVLPEMWPLLQAVADQAECASFAQITEAIRLLAHRHHVIAEAAGAVSVAAALGAKAGKVTLSASFRVVTSMRKNWALSSAVRIPSKEHGANQEKSTGREFGRCTEIGG